ncbi:YSIRK-type signal peptide-containing protein [Limosilactobacillus sp. STM2_1]|uniref:YSIRK-type signal peptide-containing protein n=1 Tax=Limosilactobacillus rudii TaxID=2759755 RepID=A0A7W3UJ18_9LACO|nr:Rib/alpha-like domain-containing protein [Limosilactobacillus rudii]MBB1078358.1 YSIRK-type signal peptide-containing protein [Limosilactobacillus rudii]MBB1096488.1 YSIRK-type signal peptide-containing protein [Limosilactobacillus rudii]MCD7134316.1 YPDG domain-containing protein [Limosilactobacillus rudii]
MLSKNNWQEQFRKQEPKKQRFAIKKLTVGVASVLIGFTFMGLNASASADETANSQQQQPEVTTTNGDSNANSGSAQTLNSSAAATTNDQQQSQPEQVASPVATEYEGKVAAKVAEKTAQQASTNAKPEVAPTSQQSSVSATDTKTKTVSFTPEDSNAIAGNLGESKVATQANNFNLGIEMLAALPTDQQATPVDENEQHVSDWNGFINALSNTSVSTIDIDQGFTVTGKTSNGQIGGQSLGYNGCLNFNAQNSARKLTINGNKNTIDFGRYTLMFQDVNQKNGGAWDITLNDLTMKGVAKDSQGETSTTNPGTYGLLSFANVSAKNQQNDTITLKDVTADVTGRPIISGANGANKTSEYYTLNLSGNNNFTNEGYDGGATPADDGSAIEAGYVNITDGTTTINMTKTSAYNLQYGGNAIRTIQPDVADKEGNVSKYTMNVAKDATLNITGAKNVKGIYAVDGTRGTVNVDGTINMNMGTGHSIAIFAGNLNVNKDASVDVTTAQDQNGDSLIGITNFDGGQYGVLSIGVGQPGNLSNQKANAINDSGSIKVVRTSEAKTNSKIISMGSGSQGLINGDFRINVNDGATLDLQDSVEQSTTGMIYVSGTNVNSYLNFTHPKYVNLQRLNNHTVGKLIYLEGHNQTTINNSPIAQWDEANFGGPSNTWVVSNVASYNNTGADAGTGFTQAGKQGSSTGKGVDKFLHSNGTVTMAPSQAGLNSFRYNGTQLAAGSKTQGIIVQGTGIDGADYYQPYLNQFLNHFNYWTPQRLSMGTKLLNDPEVGVKEADKYAPETQVITGYTDQTLNDLDAAKGIKDYIENDGKTSSIVANDLVGAKVTWYNATNDASDWQSVMGDYPAPTNPTGNLKLSDTSAWAKVTYKDNSVDFVNIPLDIKSQADEYNPQGQNVNTTVGKEPAAKDGISNVSTLPADAKYSWSTTPDVSKAGIVPSIVNVTYSDGSVDQVPVDVIVKDDKGDVPGKDGDAAKNDPQGKDVSTVIGTVPDASTAVDWPKAPVDADGNSIDPSQIKYDWSTTPDIWTKGEHPGVVQVTYPDGTTDLVPTNVTVKNSPAGQATTIKQGGQVPEPSTVIDWTDNGQVPDGTKPTDPNVKYTWVNQPDPNTPGQQTGTVQITYPNGESTVVRVPVTVIPTNGTYDPYAKNLDLPYSPTGAGVPAADTVVELPSGETAPDGVQYTWGTKPDTTKPGIQTADITATWTTKDSNGNDVTNTKNIPVSVNVGPMADYYNPSATDLTVPFNADMNKYPAKNQITGIPSDVATTDVWAPMPVTSVSGTEPTMIKVTYSDGSFDYVPLNVTVEANVTDADKYEPEYKPVSLMRGTSATDKPSWKDDKTPTDGDVTFTSTTDTPAWATVAKDGTITLKPAADLAPDAYTVPVKVTYKDGSSETVYAPVAVNGENTTVYYGNQATTSITVGEYTSHKTTDGSATVAAPPVTEIEFKNQDKNWKVLSSVTYKLQGDKYVATTPIVDADGNAIQINGSNAPESFSAADVQTKWKDGFTPNTNASNYESTGNPAIKGSGTGTSLASTNYKEAPYGDQRTESGNLAGNSKTRVNITMSGSDNPFNVNTWSNAFGNIYGATTGETLTFKQNQDMSKLSADQFNKLINTTDLSSHNFKFTLGWAPDKAPSTKDIADKVAGTVRISFSDGTYLDIPATINVTGDDPVPYEPGTPGKDDEYNHYVVRTIKYNVADTNHAAIADQTQSVHYVRKDKNGNAGYIDPNTGNPVYVDWTLAEGQTAAWPEKEVTQITGYDSYVDGTKATSVAKQGVSAKTDNATVTVTYKSNTINPTNPDDKDQNDLFLDVHRDVYVSGNKDKNLSQTLHYARNKVIDTATQKVVSYGDWVLGKLEDGKWVAGGTAEFTAETAPDSKDPSKTTYVQYGANGERTATNEIKAVPVTTKDVTESTGQNIATPQNGESVYVTYDVASHEVNPTDPTKEDQKDLFMNVSRDVYVSGKKSDDLSQTLHYARTKEVNTKTGVVISYGDWVLGKLENGNWVAGGTAEFTAETAPDKTGYTTYVQYGEDKDTKTATNEIKSEEVPTTKNDKGYVTPEDGTPVYVTYQENTPTPVEDVTVSYQFYDTTDKKNVGNPITVTGKPGSVEKTGLKVPENYELAKGQTLPEEVTIPAKGETIVINLVHGTKDITPTTPGVDPNKPKYKDMFTTVSRDIYQTKPNESEKLINTQKVEFGRNGIEDKVTGKVTGTGAWEVGKTENGIFVPGGSSDFAKEAVEQFNGYVSYVNNKVSTEIAAESALVNGVPTNAAAVHITYVEGVPVPYNPTDKDMNKDVTRTITVYTTTDDKTETITQNVHFVRGGEGQTAGTKDADGKITWGAWTVATKDGNTWKSTGATKGTWAQYDVPQVDGYTSTVDGKAAKDVAANNDVTADTDPSNVTVAYTKSTQPTDPSINPNNPGENSDMFAHPTRTINVTNPLTGKTDAQTQTVWFGRTKTVSTDPNVKPVYGEWQLGKVDGDKFVVDAKAPNGWAEFDAPVFNGYIPSQAKVAAVNDITATTKDATVNITYTETDAHKYTADGGNITVDKGHVLDNKDAQNAIVNNNKLPEGTTYTWKDAPSTATIGDKNGIVTVTYPDGSVDNVPVMVHVTDQAAKYDPEGQVITIKKGDKVPDPEQGIKNTADLPSGTKYTWEVAPDPSKVGQQPVVITVTYPDGSQDQVPTTVIVTDNTPTPTKTDADKYTPEGQVVTVNKGDKLPDAVNGIKNSKDLPSGTKYTWKTNVDTNTPGDKPAVITVTYPDGSAEDVPTIVHVNPSDADKYTPQGQNITVNKGDKVPDPATAITNKGDLPQGTKYTWETTPDTNKVGDQPATVVVTYPDGSQDNVPVIITVKNTETPVQSDADKYNPEGGTITAKLNEDLSGKAADDIVNKDTLPAGTKYAWTDGTPSTKTAGLTMHYVTVTYPDGSSEVVPAYVNVTSDADEYSPVPQTVTVKKGQTPDPADGIKNKGDLPKGTDYTWKTPVDTTTPGDKPATVVVTYPDGSKEEVPTVVQVYTPAEGQNVNTIKGNVPAPTKGIKNMDEVPTGTKVEWTNPDKVKTDVNTLGNHDEQITVTYPDGTKDTITVTVTVKNPATPNPTDAEKNNPIAQPITTPEGVVPEASEGIKNKDQLPGGTKYEWKNKDQVANDVKKPGTHTETIVVTYPDGSTDEVTVTVTVPAPEGQNINTNQGVLPNPSDAIKNKDQMPDGTKYEWKVQPDVTTPGDHTGVVEVIFPDGTTYDVEVTVHVNAVNNSNVKSDNNNNSTVAPQEKTSTVNKTASVSAPAAASVKNNSQTTTTNNSKQLPQTGNETNETTSLVGLGLAAIASLFGLGGLRKKNDNK